MLNIVVIKIKSNTLISQMSVRIILRIVWSD